MDQEKLVSLLELQNQLQMELIELKKAIKERRDLIISLDKIKLELRAEIKSEIRHQFSDLLRIILVEFEK